MRRRRSFGRCGLWDVISLLDDVGLCDVVGLWDVGLWDVGLWDVGL